MRHFHLFIYFPFLALLATLSACVGEELSRPAGEGRLRLEIASVTAEVSSAAQTKAEETATVQTELTNLPEEKDFSVKVMNATGEVVFDKPIAEMPKEGILLETGKYTVEAYYGDNQEPITTTLPRYFAGSTTVSIIPGETATASISAKWGYSAVYPVIAEDLAAHYKSYHLDVEVGQTQKQISPNTDHTFPTVYLLAGTNASVHLAGTNYTNQEVSNPLFTQTTLPAAKEYTLKVTSDIPVFSFGLRATATHTKDASGYLDGTKVTLALGDLSSVPIALISAWTAELVNASNEVVRTYTSTDFTAPDGMLDANAWPYLPQGNYTLKYKYTLNGKEVSEEQTEAVTVVVPAPEFEVTFAPYTSYTKYLAGDIEGANNCENNKIYNIKASVNIANELLAMDKYNASFIYTNEKGEPENIQTNSFERDDASVSEWRQYAIKATVTLAGITKEAAPEVHITGLPYRAEPPRNTGEHTWRIIQGNITFNNDYILLGSHTSKDPIVGSSSFYIPQNISFKLSSKYQKNSHTLANRDKYEYEVNLLSGDTRGERICYNNEASPQEYIVEGTQTFTSEYNAVSCRFQTKTALGATANLISVYIDYN